jgi:hypothetical protein
MRLSNIKAPKFRINGKIYNEYELREIMVKVGKKELPTLKVVQVDTKQVAQIKAPGYLTDSLNGLAIIDKLQLELLQLKYKGQ